MKSLPPRIIKTQRMQRALMFFFLVAAAGGELVYPSPLNFSMDRQSNHSTMATSASSTSAQEATKIESWSPSQPEFTQMVSHPQPFVPPAHYYRPGNRFFPPTSEYRSEHYHYPYELNYAYPISQSTVDSSLIPTTKHFVIVSFIGLLLLFAIIQNSITSAKRKDALVEVLSNRRKRNITTWQTHKQTDDATFDK